MLSLDFQTMGCQARCAVHASTADARPALERARRWFTTAEAALSRFDPESALARLNARGGADRVDDLLWEAIDVALHVAAATDGCITPTILPALEGAGYDRRFHVLAREQEGPLAKPCTVPDWRTIERDETTRSIRLPGGVRLDLAGTAKAWCVDVAASHLEHFGPALVEVGGDIAARGQRPSGWTIAVEDPRGGADPLALVLLRGGAIATSGRDFRRWTRSGIPQHHLIDPRTGAPARTDILTATVIASTALEADVFAKCLLLEGSGKGMAQIEARTDLAALVVVDSGRILPSARFRDYAWRSVA